MLYEITVMTRQMSLNKGWEVGKILYYGLQYKTKKDFLSQLIKVLQIFRDIHPVNTRVYYFFAPMRMESDLCWIC